MVKEKTKINNGKVSKKQHVHIHTHSNTFKRTAADNLTVASIETNKQKKETRDPVECSVRLRFIISQSIYIWLLNTRAHTPNTRPIN